MNKTTIDWPGLTHTFNPVVGCKRNCSKKTHGFDCYANDLHTKRREAYNNGAKLPMRHAKPFNKIQYFPQSLQHQVKKSKVVKKVFIGSMSDICYWPHPTVEDVIRFCRERPGIEFMFLTKDPTVYIHHNFPINCWLGYTVTKQEDLATGCGFGTPVYWNYLMVGNDCRRDWTNKKFLSIEPLIDKITLGYNEEKYIDLVIVGADSSKDPVIPKKEWIESIKHPNIHWKKSMRKYL